MDDHGSERYSHRTLLLDLRVAMSVRRRVRLGWRVRHADHTGRRLGPLSVFTCYWGALVGRLVQV